MLNLPGSGVLCFAPCFLVLGCPDMLLRQSKSLILPRDVVHMKDNTFRMRLFHAVLALVV